MRNFAAILFAMHAVSQPSDALPVPETNTSPSLEQEAHGRLLKRADISSVRETYARAHLEYGNVMARFKPIIDKMLTSRVPNFLTDFMETVKGFTSDLAWVPRNPAIGSMLSEALNSQVEQGSPGVAPLPQQLKVGPGIPKSAMCGNSTMCTEIVDWVKMVNEDLRKGETPNPLKQIAAQNAQPELLGPWAVPGPVPGEPSTMPAPIGMIPPMDLGALPPLGAAFHSYGEFVPPRT